MKSLFRLVKVFCLTSLCVFCILSCSNYGFFWGLFGEDDVDDRSSSMKNLQSEIPDFASQTKAPSSSYSVLILTDMHFGATKEDIDEKAFLNWLEKRFQDTDYSKLPRFAINLGDTADGGHDSEYRQYLDFEKKIKALAGKYLYGENDETADSNRKFKVYGILGNHDLYNNGVTGFMKYMYPYNSSYFFHIDQNGDKSGFSYYFLDTANGTTGKDQLDDFKSKIEADPRPKIVLTHYPVWAGGADGAFAFMILQNTMERNILLTYFAENNVRQVYEGHAHANYGYDFTKFREDVIGSLRFSSRAKKQCAVCTVNEATKQVSTEIIEF